MTLIGFRFCDRLGQGGAQRIAVEVTGEFVAGGKIGEALALAPRLGDVADHAGDAFRRAVMAENADRGQRVPYGPKRRGQFHLNAEGCAAYRSGTLDEIHQQRAAFRMHQSEKIAPTAQLIGIGLTGKNFECAFPFNHVVSKCPIERDCAGSRHRHAQLFRFGGSLQRSKSLYGRLLQRLFQHDPPSPAGFPAVG